MLILSGGQNQHSFFLRSCQDFFFFWGGREGKDSLSLAVLEKHTAYNNIAILKAYSVKDVAISRPVYPRHTRNVCGWIYWRKPENFRLDTQARRYSAFVLKHRSRFSLSGLGAHSQRFGWLEFSSLSRFPFAVFLRDFFF